MNQAQAFLQIQHVRQRFKCLQKIPFSLGHDFFGISVVRLAQFRELRQLLGGTLHGLFKHYRLVCWFRGHQTNMYLSIKLPHIGRPLYQMSLGMLRIYNRKKKRKKTYLAGVDFGGVYLERLGRYRIKSFVLTQSGSGAFVRGITRSFQRSGERVYYRDNKTPIAHNGTRLSGRRRL